MDTYSPWRIIRTGALMIAAAAGVAVFAVMAFMTAPTKTTPAAQQQAPAQQPQVIFAAAQPQSRTILAVTPAVVQRPTSTTDPIIVPKAAVPKAAVPKADNVIFAPFIPPRPVPKPPSSDPKKPAPQKPAGPKTPVQKPIRTNCAAGRVPDPDVPGACKAAASSPADDAGKSAQAFLKGFGGKVTIKDLETLKAKFPKFKWVVVGDKVLGMDWVHPGGAAFLDPYVNEPRADIKKSAWGGQYAWHLDHPSVKSILKKNTIATLVDVTKDPTTTDTLTTDPKATVIVDYKQAWGGELKRIFGTYRSEERENYDKIYDVDRTLGPLKMASNRFQISVQNDEIGADGTWLDGKGTQRGILKLLEKSSDAVFVTVGFPWTTKSEKFIKGGFSDGSWRAYFSRVYATLAKSLAAAKTKDMFIEIFGEPDLTWWDWVYGKDPQRVYEIAKMVHDEFRKYPGFKIGGLGFACAQQGFVCLPRYIDNFIDYYKAKNMKFDFWSFHSYLGWTDRSDPSSYPPAEVHYNFGSQVKLFKETLNRRGLGTTTVICSEYAWQDGDGAASWGFKEPGKSARGSMTDHRSAARTLQAIEIVRNAPYPVALAFWAQGVGGTLAAPDGQKWGYAYNPLVIYHENRWRYKASYYAFWMVCKVYGSRLIRETKNKNPKLGVVPSANGIIIFNKSPQAQAVTLSVNGVSASRKCTMYLVDSKTFRTSKGGLDAVVSGPTNPTPPRVVGVTTVGQALKSLRTLGPEAVACIVFEKQIENPL